MLQQFGDQYVTDVATRIVAPRLHPMHEVDRLAQIGTGCGEHIVQKADYRSSSGLLIGEPYQIREMLRFRTVRRMW